MKIETLHVAGIQQAILAMRNPMNSWDKSDSYFADGPKNTDFRVGEADRALSMRLQQAGPEHCKHLRLIMVWADITAPLYWWKQFDCYRAGVEKVSCSTMHKLMSRDLTVDDFEHDELIDETFEKYQISKINSAIHAYKFEDDPKAKAEIFRGVVQFLPQSYLQKRTVVMSYAALRNICRQREGHKLVEWHMFRDWARTLPESWMITE